MSAYKSILRTHEGSHTSPLNAVRTAGLFAADCNTTLDRYGKSLYSWKPITRRQGQNQARPMQLARKGSRLAPDLRFLPIFLWHWRLCCGDKKKELKLARKKGEESQAAGPAIGKIKKEPEVFEASNFINEKKKKQTENLASGLKISMLMFVDTLWFKLKSSACQLLGRISRPGYVL